MAPQQSADRPDAAPWLVTRTLLNVQTQTAQAVEHHLLIAYLWQTAGADDELAYALEEAITEHQRIVDDLRTAVAALDVEE